MANQLDNLLKSNSDAEPDASFRMVVFDDETIIRYDGDETTIVQQIFKSLKRKPEFQKQLNKVLFHELLSLQTN